MYKINEIEIIFDNLRSYLNEQEGTGAGDQIEAEIEAAQAGLGPMLGNSFALLIQLRSMTDNPKAKDQAHRQADLIASTIRHFTEGRQNIFETVSAIQTIMAALEKTMMEIA